MPFFDERYLPDEVNEYVCWMDIMGTKNKMDNSVRTCANFIFKFHSAIIKGKNGMNIVSYPVMDGVYLTSKIKQDILTVISKVFILLARDFIDEPKNKYRFLIKGALSYGPIIHGVTVCGKQRA